MKGNDSLFNTTNDTGRSMVETIGVLAIIGLLSIGSIMGYSYAMDKYYASETINDISLRGIEVISLTNNNQTIDEETLEKIWKDETPIYPTSVFYEAEYDRFGIQITDVPSRVCRFIGDGIAEHIETRIEVAESEIDINDHIEFCDLSDKNTMHFFFEPRKCLPACHTNEVCIEGVCQGAECEAHDDCNQGYTGTQCAVCSSGKCIENFNVEGKECTFTDGVAGQCHQGTCMEKPEEGCTYDTNICDAGLYCTASNTSDTVAFQEGETGICIEPRFTEYTITVNNVRETWYMSDGPLSWWDATAACATENLIMAPVSKLVNNWTAGEGGFTRNDRAKALNTGAYIDVWTTSQSGSSALSVSLNTDLNNVYSSPKNISTYSYALCQANSESCQGCTYDECTCAFGLYCAASNTSSSVAFQTGETGTCKRPTFNVHVITADGTTKTWYVSSTPLSWWDAKAACAAANLTLVSPSDLVNGWSSGNGVYAFNAQALALKELENISVWTANTNAYGSGIFITLNGAYTNNVEAWSGKNATTTGKTSLWALCKE